MSSGNGAGGYQHWISEIFEEENFKAHHREMFIFGGFLFGWCYWNVIATVHA